MKRHKTFSARILSTIGLLLLLCCAVGASEPALVRVTFWVPSERIEEFEVAYEREVVPLLVRHGLIESAIPGRPTVEGTFSRLFELTSLDDYPGIYLALQADSSFIAVKKSLGKRFGSTRYIRKPSRREEIDFAYHLYSTPARSFRKSRPLQRTESEAEANRVRWKDRLQSVKEPTLARLSFWMPPERVADFEAVYEERIVPLLKERGLVESTQQGRPTVDGVFSRLFEFAYQAAEFESWATELERHVASQEQREGLAKWLLEEEVRFPREEFAVERITFDLYSAPLRVGEIVPAGRGKGHWKNYTGVDGLIGVGIEEILEDRDGYLWFGTNRGVSRFDGRDFRNFMPEDGLISNITRAIFQDDSGQFWIGSGGVRGRGWLNRSDGREPISFRREEALGENGVLAIHGDRDGNIWFGSGTAGVSRFDGEQFRHFTQKDGLPDSPVTAIQQDRAGNIWFGTWGKGVSRFDGKRFQTFTLGDGLSKDNFLESIHQDRDGNIWLATIGGFYRFFDEQFEPFSREDRLVSDSGRIVFQDKDGDFWFATGEEVSRFDGEQFEHFGREDGLANNLVDEIVQDREGHIWFGTIGGASRYDGETLRSFTTEDGLGSDLVEVIFQDRDGYLWFGAEDVISRFDGEKFENFFLNDWISNIGSIFQDRDGYIWFGAANYAIRFDGRRLEYFAVEDGLLYKSINSIHQDRDGYLWFGVPGGASRYDGESFESLTYRNGLVGFNARSILQDRDGYLWFSCWTGLTRYDGERFESFSREDGIVGDGNLAIFQARNGDLWFENHNGATRYDGERFRAFSVEDGLSHGNVYGIGEDREGNIWIGTDVGIVNRFDGEVLQTLTEGDGLTGDSVHSILQADNGDIWIGTLGGAIRYRRPPDHPPPITIEAVIGDQRYDGASEVALPYDVGLITFEFFGRSFKTRPEGMVYLYRLQGYDGEWRTAYEERAEYQDLPPGDYLFEVKAVDRDLVYSKEPATVRVHVSLPYERIGLSIALGLSLIGLIVAVRYGFRRRRERDLAREQLVQELEEELQVAHDLQMGLMPTESPQIPGFDIAGRCLTANHVGGDCFQYFPRDDKLLVCLADVTGHAMEAAIPVVMFDGILKSQIELEDSLEQLFDRLNRTLCDTLDSRTFVCFTMAEIDLSSRRLRLANGGCPYTYHFRVTSGDVAELQVDAYPLGIRPDTAYASVEVQLEPGDYLVFCSDGIIEAENRSGELFDFGRTADTVQNSCRQGLNSEELVGQLIAAVKRFAGEVAQGDDQTIVVVRMEE
jgi:ligand-binding sensor domain-containing protein/serine phosphatase RsbU (regulator of sigma subunit)